MVANGPGDVGRPGIDLGQSRVDAQISGSAWTTSAALTPPRAASVLASGWVCVPGAVVAADRGSADGVGVRDGAQFVAGFGERVEVVDVEPCGDDGGAGCAGGAGHGDGAGLAGL